MIETGPRKVAVHMAQPIRTRHEVLAEQRFEKKAKKSGKKKGKKSGDSGDPNDPKA